MEGVFIANYEVLYIWSNYYSILLSNLANTIHRGRDTSPQFLQLNHSLSLFGEDALLKLTNTRGIS